MDKRCSVQSSSARAPLGENLLRANSAPSSNASRHSQSIASETECRPNVPTVLLEGVHVSDTTTQASKHAPQPSVNPRLSSVLSQATQDRNAAKRSSQASTATTARSSEGGIKSYIGPWQLGRTLGKGSSARVRLARHRVTHQSVAVKIIAKRTAYLSQAGSIAKLDKAERNKPEEEDGVRRMPVTIEREIAIMKLIEHEKVIKILDVWENRNEM